MDRLTVHIRALEAFGRHGVFPAERDLGQRFLVDLDLVLIGTAAVRTDDLADTVDYAALAARVSEIVAGPPVALLERLAALIADAALDDPRVGEATVTVRKPHVAVPQTLRETAVTLTRARA